MNTDNKVTVQPQVMDLKLFFSILLKGLEKQGLTFLIMAAAIWYFHIQHDQQQCKIDTLQTTIQSCNDRIISFHEQHNTKVTSTMVTTNILLERIADQLDRQQKK